MYTHWHPRRPFAYFARCQHGSEAASRPRRWVSPTLSFDITRPGFEAVGATALAANAPLYAVAAGSTLSIPSNGAAFNANGSQGLLLLHHNNVAEQQAQVIRITGRSAALGWRVYLSRVLSQPTERYRRPLR